MANLALGYDIDAAAYGRTATAQLADKRCWVAINVFLIICVGLAVPGLGVVARYVYPAITFVLATYLYNNSRPLYFGFCWWSWIGTAEFVRFVEYSSSSFDTSRIMLAAPYLTCLVVLPTAIKQLLRVRQNMSPLLLPVVAVLYGTIISANQGISFLILFKATLEWLCPVLFAFSITESWRQYPRYRKVLTKLCRWAIILLGVYGIIQYLIAPPWDRYWLEQIAANGLAGNAFGQPAPLQIRVYSLMNSPGEFAVFSSACLLIQFCDRNLTSLGTSLAGYISFLLAAVRSSWGGWVVGMMVLLSMPRPRLHSKAVLMGVLAILILIPVLSMEEFSDTVTSRFETFGDLDNDGSKLARVSTYRRLLPQALTSVVGMGIGRAPGSDSAVLDSLLSIGWIGVLPYLAGLLIPLFLIIKRPIEGNDDFLQACKAVYCGSLLQLPFGSAMLGLSGTVLWGFSALVVSGVRYDLYKEQKKRQSWQERLPFRDSILEESG